MADFRAKLRRLTGAATVPQVLIHGEPVGGRRRSLFKRGYEVRLVDADGRLLAKAEALSEREAEGIAAGLAGEFRTGAS